VRRRGAAECESVRRATASGWRPRTVRLQSRLATTTTTRNESVNITRPTATAHWLTLISTSRDSSRRSNTDEMKRDSWRHDRMKLVLRKNLKGRDELRLFVGEEARTEMRYMKKTTPSNLYLTDTFADTFAGILKTTTVAFSKRSSDVTTVSRPTGAALVWIGGLVLLALGFRSFSCRCISFSGRKSSNCFH